MNKRFARDYSEILAEEKRIKELRAEPVSVSSIANKQPLTVLEELVKMWPTHDVRYDGYGTSDDDLIIDMIKGTETRTTRKDLTKGILDITVEMVKNLDEIERYNAAIGAHNREWVEQGSPEEVFDPVHGDVFDVQDKFVDPVMMQSKHYDLPKSAYSGTSSGKLANARPNIARKSHTLVRYQMRIIDDRFVLGYAAYDYDGRIIYYNEFSHKNLAYLVRRSVQEIWGNPTAHLEFDALLEGVSMLINGKKLAICKNDNTLPEFLALEKSQLKSTKAIEKIEKEEAQSVSYSNFTGFYLPMGFIIGFVICALWSFMNMGVEMDSDNLLPVFLPLLLCILFLIGTISCRSASQEADRHASELGAKKKFM
jgi:hypothetical protein